MTKRSSTASSRKKPRSRSSSRRSSSKKPQPTLWQQLSRDQKLDILGWVLIVVATLTILSMLSAQQGILTQWWISLLSQIFGWGRYVVPIFLGSFGLWLVLRHFGDKIPTLDPEQIVGVILGFFVTLTTMHFVVVLIWPQVDLYALGRRGVGGGLTGAFLVETGTDWLGSAGLVFTLLIGWIITITFAASVSPAEAVQIIVEWREQRRTRLEANKDISQKQIPEELLKSTHSPESIVRGTAGATESPTAPRIPPKINVAGRVSNGNGELRLQSMQVGTQKWRLPSVTEMLEEGSEQYYSENLIRHQVRIIEATLESFGAPVSVSEINQGPVVTQFGMEPLFTESRGRKTKVKVSKIANLADDLALALSDSREGTRRHRGPQRGTGHCLLARRDGFRQLWPAQGAFAVGIGAECFRASCCRGPARDAAPADRRRHRCRKVRLRERRHLRTTAAEHAGHPETDLGRPQAR